MVEEEVVAFPVQPSDYKRKLEDPTNEVPLDDCKKASDYSQAKRPKVDDEAVNGLGIGEERPDESKEEGNGILQKDENQEQIHAEESENKMDAVDVNALN